ncbi:hypothetical protein COU17_03320 [Candidatus Kaiserbacteria bacterium CG10_big_fil_rev_8_21_14_0_10_49_17]|uniref:PKD domain-containing protein n=1 Tax=Candidatus Kaiserbacteria bacterium CG10_big_fil_rev_8_21_14_0_10_49_17 TaxID=1974609 RepID=A0A2M6WDV5_9BACT|nr:MAG: hypothetical protein COU17_03320 [Candidatus Kaiserbacteria bacterium CG10_big_fil_rev_8_21_14_0_10_49_17]
MRYALLIFTLFFLPITAHAQILFSEIMYDLEGSDAGREWVEIVNTGATSVSLSGWRFFEADTNHKLTIVQGDETLASGDYAVLADDATAFLAENAEYSGTLFDSSFSLKNTGEYLAIRDSELVDQDSLTYNSDWGAGGDGNTLSRSASNSWEAGAPTPGSGVVSIDSGDPQSPSTSEETVTNDTRTNIHQTTPYRKQTIFADAGEDRVVSVGADVEYEGEAFGLTGEALEGARFLWNFGNGRIAEGKSILHHYEYPGEYVVVLSVSSGEYSASDRMLVHAREARIEIAVADGEIVLSNTDTRELDLSFWMVRAGGATFQLPKNTYLLKGAQLTLARSLTKLPLSSAAFLLYPNGMLAATTESSTAPEPVTGTTSAPIAVTEARTPVKALSGKSIVGATAPVGESAIKRTLEPEAQATSAARIVAEDTGGEMYKWLLALAGIIGIAVAGMLFASRSKDEWELID